MTTDRTLNAMTVDVEEYFQVSAFDRVVDRTEWPEMPSRIRPSMQSLLDLLDEHDVRATFFTLGWIGEHHPEIVRQIAAAGHEVACHGYDHRLLYDRDPQELLRETRKARAILQDLSGQPVVGYRAASFSIGRGNLWALDVLADAGFEYDSSLFPVVHDRYGVPGAPRLLHRLQTPGGNSLIEIPPSTFKFAGLVLPAAGGGYLRLLPLAVTRWAINRLNRRDHAPAVVYIHPWELDPDQPRLKTKWTTRRRHYGGIRGVRGKLSALMRDYRFGPLGEIVARSRTGSDVPTVMAASVG